MSTFVEQLRLAEKAAEDIYFAKVNRELIKALHNPVLAAKSPFTPSCGAEEGAEMLESIPSVVTGHDR